MLKISLVVPVYNVEKYLITCLESILAQTYKFYEVILVDDGSTDKSGVICDEFQRKYKQFTVIHTKNVGASEARNIGIRQSSGDYIYFVDADDYLDSRLLDKCVNAAIKTQCDMVKIGYAKITDKGDFLYEKTIKNLLFKHHSPNEKISFICEQLLSYNLPIQPWSCFIKRKLLLENNLFFINRKIVFSEDVCFSVMAALKLNSTYTLSEPLYYFRRRTGSAMYEAKKRKNRNIDEYNNMSKLIFNTCGQMFTENQFSLIHHSLLKIRIKKTNISQIRKEMKALSDKDYFYRMNKLYYFTNKNEFCSVGGIYFGLKNKSLSKFLANNKLISFTFRNIFINIIIKPIYFLKIKLSKK